MSILIKGMEMPTDGEKLYMIVFSDGKACASYKPFEWHEVVSVPEPHGRLIDADDLRDRFYEDYFRFDAEAIVDYIRANAPTIIPASKEE